MSTSSPDDPSNILEEMAKQLGSLAQPHDAEDVTQLSNFEIADRLSDIDMELKKRQELLNPKTEEARELHSRRTALVVEMNKRKSL